MDKEEKKENNKTKKGETFYKAIPATATAPKELDIPRISAKTADFLESIVIFVAGTAELLLILRILLMIVGVNGDNLLTYLLYASSYPFVIVFGSSQGQVPVVNNNAIFENIVFLTIYFIISYGLIKIIRAMKVAKNND